jgi:hypothetical protein
MTVTLRVLANVDEVTERLGGDGLTKRETQQRKNDAKLRARVVAVAPNSVRVMSMRNGPSGACWTPSTL